MPPCKALALRNTLRYRYAMTSLLQIRLLNELSRQPARTVSELASRVGGSRPAVSRSLKPLVAQGMVARTRSSIAVTDAGSAELAQAMQGVSASIAQMSKALLRNDELLRTFSVPSALPHDLFDIQPLRLMANKQMGVIADLSRSIGREAFGQLSAAANAAALPAFRVHEETFSKLTADFASLRLSELAWSASVDLQTALGQLNGADQAIKALGQLNGADQAIKAVGQLNGGSATDQMMESISQNFRPVRAQFLMAEAAEHLRLISSAMKLERPLELDRPFRYLAIDSIRAARSVGLSTDPRSKVARAAAVERISAAAVELVVPAGPREESLGEILNAEIAVQVDSLLEPYPHLVERWLGACHAAVRGGPDAGSQALVSCRELVHAVIDLAIHLKEAAGAPPLKPGEEGQPPPRKSRIKYILNGRHEIEFAESVASSLDAAANWSSQTLHTGSRVSPTVQALVAATGCLVLILLRQDLDVRLIGS